MIDGMMAHFSKVVESRQFTDSGAFRISLCVDFARSLTRRGYGSRIRNAPLPRHCRNDLAAVEPAVFDENVRGIFAAHDHSSDVHPWNVSFQCAGVGLRAARLRIELNALALEKFEIRVIAGHRKYLDGRNGSLMTRIFH